MIAEGMRFTDHYAGSSVCAPSRCALMTGKHSGQGRIRGNGAVDIEDEELTVAEIWDFLPTVCEVINVEIPEKINGISFLPEMLEQSQQKHELLYWEFLGYWLPEKEG